MDELNMLKGLVEKMQSAGLRFLIDKSDLADGEAYAVLGGKSSIKHLQTETDGVDSYAIYCSDDEVDMNRLCNVLNRAYYDTDDDKRPYEVRFTTDEIDKVINILKMNLLNIANADRTVNRGESRHHDSERISGPMTWLVSANSGFDTIRAFRELKTLDWNQGAYKLKEDDIVYIYLGRPVRKVRLKCKVVRANMPCGEIDDRKYITDIEDWELEEEFIPAEGNTMQLTILTEYKESDLFGYKALEEHGVMGAIRTPRTITGATLEYFKSLDVPENIQKNYE